MCYLFNKTVQIELIHNLIQQKKLYKLNEKFTGRVAGDGESLGFFFRGVLVEEPISNLNQHLTFDANSKQFNLIAPLKY